MGYLQHFMEPNVPLPCCHWSLLSHKNSNHTLYTVSLRSILTLSSHLHHNGLVPSGFHTNTLYDATYSLYPAHVIVLNLIVLVIFGKEYKLWSSLLRIFPTSYYIWYSLFNPKKNNILLWISKAFPLIPFRRLCNLSSPKQKLLDSMIYDIIAFWEAQCFNFYGIKDMQLLLS